MSTETTTGRERRRYTRHPLQLEAFIVLGRRQPVACTVRDFCQAGMFLALDPAHLSGVAPPQRVTLHFALIIDGEQNDYQVELDVARVVSRGIGCAFANTEGDIVRLLGGLVGAGEAATDEKAPEDKQFAAEYRDLVGPLCALADRHSRYMVEKFLKEADESLFLAARDSVNNIDQSIFIDTQAEVRRHKDDIVTLVTEAVETGVREIGDPLEDTAARTDAPGLNGLSLIEKEEFEEFLTVSEIVADIEPKYSDELYALEQR
ncbi:MAG: DUF1631 family protein, partial [Gammaproteobacteria bacterium]|nr:DUF1631 family protein [Gammaproteobacteria bacterium]